MTKATTLITMLAASATTSAIDFNISMQADMRYDQVVLAGGGTSRYFSSQYYWNNNSRKDGLRYDWVGLRINDEGFRFDLYSQGRCSYNRYFGSSSERYGYGIVQGSFTISTSGNYHVDALLNCSNYLEGDMSPALGLTGPNGRQIIGFWTAAHFHRTIYLERGTYNFESRYNSHGRFVVYDMWEDQRMSLSVQLVPEPGTILALGAGLAWLGRKRAR